MRQSQESNRRLLRSALPNLAPGYGDSAHDKAAERLARDMDKPVGALLACITDDRQRAMYQAAPDLYAALGAIESYLTSHLVIGKNGKASTEVANMLDAARAALARAKGGAA